MKKLEYTREDYIKEKALKPKKKKKEKQVVKKKQEPIKKTIRYKEVKHIKCSLCNAIDKVKYLGSEKDISCKECHGGYKELIKYTERVEI